MPRPFTDEQSRCLVNLAQRYDSWITAERAIAGLPYDLRRKTVSGREYLYEISDRGGNGTSLGPMTAERESQLAEYKRDKAALKDRLLASAGAVDESGRLYRALRLPMLASEAGRILREADARSMLGDAIMVIGTNAMPAYAVEAASFLDDAPTETDDFDLAWTGAGQPAEERRIWALLKAVDPTFTLNSEREFQARNRAAYEVELLVAPSRSAGLARTDQPRAVELPEQEWLLLGRTVDHVVACRDASPARIVAPDPRWFALHKLWLARKKDRNPLKRRKDELQGLALLDAVDLLMPQFPLDTAFEGDLPVELRPLYEDWASKRVPRPSPPWA